MQPCFSAILVVSVGPEPDALQLGESIGDTPNPLHGAIEKQPIAFCLDPKVSQSWLLFADAVQLIDQTFLGLYKPLDLIQSTRGQGEPLAIQNLVERIDQCTG